MIAINPAARVTLYPLVYTNDACPKRNRWHYEHLAARLSSREDRNT